MQRSMKLKMVCMLFTLFRRNWASIQCQLNTKTYIYQVSEMWRFLVIAVQLNASLTLSGLKHFFFHLDVVCFSHYVFHRDDKAVMSNIFCSIIVTS